MLFVDARKAHLNPKCEDDVYIELPEECGAGPGICGKLNFWLYGFRKAASAWEALYASYFEEVVLSVENLVGWSSIILDGVFRWRFMGMILRFVVWKRTFSGYVI